MQGEVAGLLPGEGDTEPGWASAKQQGTPWDKGQPYLPESPQESTPPQQEGVPSSHGGTPRVSLVAQMVKNPPTIQETRVLSLGSSPGEGNSNLLQYSCLENSMGRGAWWVTVRGITEPDTTE